MNLEKYLFDENYDRVMVLRAMGERDYNYTVNRHWINPEDRDDREFYKYLWERMKINRMFRRVRRQTKKMRDEILIQKLNEEVDRNIENYVDSYGYWITHIRNFNEKKIKSY